MGRSGSSRQKRVAHLVRTLLRLCLLSVLINRLAAALQKSSISSMPARDTELHLLSALSAWFASAHHAHGDCKINAAMHEHLAAHPLSHLQDVAHLAHAQP